MMRKLVAVFILISMAIFASVPAFAINPSKADRSKQNVETKALNVQIRDLEKQVEQNSKKLNQLKNQSLKACAAAKARILALQKSKLKKDKIDALAEAVKLLKQYKDELDGMNTDINMEVQTLKDAKSQNKLDLVIQALNEIIKSQTERMSHFQKIIDGLNQIAVA